MNVLHRLFLLAIACTVSSAAAIIDNRYFPFYQQKLPRHYGCFSGLNGNLFAMQGTIARECDEMLIEDIQVPRLLGVFDVAQLNRSADTVGINNPQYLDEWQVAVRKGPYTTNGTVQAIGMGFWYEQAFGSCALLGIQTGLAYASSSQLFLIPKSTLESYDIINTNNEIFEGRLNELEQARLNFNKLLGIEGSLWSSISALDTVVYGRLSSWHEYCLKCRYITYGLTLGGIIPAASRREVNNPASVPLGGDGHPGLLIRADGQLEMKEDWFFDIRLDFIHRQPTKKVRRIPVSTEMPLWGVQTGLTQVAPGWTVGVFPCLAVEDFVDGLGAYVQYNMVYHARDSWTDLRKNPEHAADFELLEENSWWKSEYATFGVTYNPLKACLCTFNAPTFYFDIDIPIHFFGGRGFVKTYRFSLGLEFNF